MKQRKHRIFRYGANWYADCGVCQRSLWHPRWSAAVDLLQLHVETHQPLTIEASVLQS